MKKIIFTLICSWLLSFISFPASAVTTIFPSNRPSNVKVTPITTMTASGADWPQFIQILAEILNVKTVADLASLRADLQAIDKLQFLAENRFVKNEDSYSAVFPNSSLKQVLRIQSSFFTLASKVWTTYGAHKMEMFFGIQPQVKQRLSREQFKQQLPLEIAKLEQSVPGLKVKGSLDEIDMDYARQLLRYIEHNFVCEEMLTADTVLF